MEFFLHNFSLLPRTRVGAELEEPVGILPLRLSVLFSPIGKPEHRRGAAWKWTKEEEKGVDVQAHPSGIG